MMLRRKLGQMAVDAVSVMRRVVRIGAGKIFCFFNQHRFRVALCTRFFCREVRILEVGSVAGLARYALGNVLIGTHLRCIGSEG